jgi:hypothetical protein
VAQLMHNGSRANWSDTSSLGWSGRKAFARQHRLFTPELQWQSRGKKMSILTGKRLR